MKRIILFSLFIGASAFANIGDEIAKNLIVTNSDGKVCVNSDVKALLSNDGLFTDTHGTITLNDAVKKTKSTWYNKEWCNKASEEDLAKSKRVAAGTAVLRKLHRSAINSDEKADLIIAHGGVLPSAIKMFLAAKIAYDKQGARKLVVVNGSEKFNLDMIQKSSVEDYEIAREILGAGYELPVVVQANKPVNGREVAQLVHAGFKSKMPKLEIEYIDKKDLPAYVQRINAPTRVTVAASYPQLEAHLMTFALLNKENKNFEVVSGVTAGEQEALEVLYDAQTPEEKYNFERSNFARILERIAEHLHI